MSGILDILNSELGSQIIGGVSRETNQPEDKTAAVITMALPLLMGAMNRNAKSPQGAEGLVNAIETKHDGSILDNLGDFFGGGVNEDAKQDGLGILGHVLGGSQHNVVGAITKKTGMDTDSVMRILTVVAPIVLGYLGKQKRQNNVSNQNELGNLLGGLLGGGPQETPGQQSLIESILDGDNDGSVIDDIAGMVLGNKKGGGGLLGGLFGK